MTTDDLEFDGKCAFAVSVGGPSRAPAANPRFTLAKDGKTYGFSGAVPRALFRIIPGSAVRAQRAWVSARG